MRLTRADLRPFQNFFVLKIKLSCHPDPAKRIPGVMLALEPGAGKTVTVLTAVKELLDEAESAQAVTCAMAFGPGLTLETAVLERLGCTVPQAPRPAVRLRPQPLHAS